MRTIKHEMFISEPMENKSVKELPGIGEVRAGRLERVGIKTASQLASLYNRMGRSDFESYLNNICGQNSLWTGMTITALDEYKRTHASSNYFTLPQKSIASSNAPQMKITTNSTQNKVSNGRKFNNPKNVYVNVHLSS